MDKKYICSAVNCHLFSGLVHNGRMYDQFSEACRSTGGVVGMRC